MNLVLFVNGAVKPYVDWLENRKRYGFPWYESRKISIGGGAVLSHIRDLMPSQVTRILVFFIVESF